MAYCLRESWKGVICKMERQTMMPASLDRQPRPGDREVYNPTPRLIKREKPYDGGCI